MMATTSTKFRASKLSEIELEDAIRLRERFNAHRANGGTQAQFAVDFEMPGGAAQITQHLKGQRPISLDQAKAYMRGFQCDLADISRTLAARIPVDASPAATDLQSMVDQLAITLREISPDLREEAHSAAMRALRPFLRTSGQSPTP